MAPLWLLADRHAHATKEEQKEEEKKFKELGEAYSVLSDSKKRSRYDNGQDLEDMVDGGSGFGGQYFSCPLPFFGGWEGGWGYRIGEWSVVEFWRGKISVKMDDTARNFFEHLSDISDFFVVVVGKQYQWQVKIWREKE